MSVALEAIAKLRQKDLHKVAKTDVELIRNTSIKSERWVQWNVRKIDNVKTYYEVYNPDPNQEILWVEFHAQARVFPPLASIAKLRKFEGLNAHGFMCGVELDVAKLDADQAVRKVQRQLDAVYNVVEAELKKSNAKIEPMTKNRKPCGVECKKGRCLKERNVHCVPNTVVFEPYVGNAYEKNTETEFKRRILIVGASHYCFYYKRDAGCTAACAMYGKKRDVGDGRDCGERCEWLSKSVIKAYCENDRCVDDKGKEHSGWKRTFTKFTNAFIEKRSSGSRIPVNSDVFKHLVDVEYVQGVEGAAHNDTNRVLFSAERNFEELKKTIRKMKSEIVVLWGPRVINEVYGRFGKTGSTKDIEEIDFEGRMITLVACRTHPASNDWNADDLRNLLTRVGVRPLKAKQIM